MTICVVGEKSKPRETASGGWVGSRAGGRPAMLVVREKRGVVGEKSKPRETSSEVGARAGKFVGGHT